MTKAIISIIWIAVLMGVISTGSPKPLLNRIKDYIAEVANMNTNDDSEIQYVCDLYPKCLLSGLICCPTSTQPGIGVQFG